MKWEYLRIGMKVEQDHQPVLNELGAQGWELVTAFMPDRSPLTIYVFKRPKTDDKPAKANKRA